MTDTRDPTSDDYKPADRARADSCPYCGAPHPRRMPPETHRRTDGSISILAYCARCDGDWTESYRLDRVELLRPGRTTDT